jgi:hypothetical protein
MPDQLGPIEVCCDAPPYAVVEACERLGFQSPLDVRWCQVSHFLPGREGAGVLRSWKALFGLGRAKEGSCPCGEPLPVLDKYAFFFRSGKEADYFLGQCRCCRTVFWEDSPPSSPWAGSGAAWWGL